MLSYLVIFAFVVSALGVKSKKSLPRPISRNLLPMSYSRSFMVFGLTFKSLIHCELIFVYGIRAWFYSFANGCQVFPPLFIEKTFSPLCILSTFIKNGRHWFISGLFILSH